MIKHIYIIFLFLSLAEYLEGKTEFKYGLSFNSYEVEKEERTSLNLTPTSPFSFSNGFILEFDVKFKKVLHNFGYVFRIISENNQIDLLLNRTNNSYVLEPQLTVIYKSGEILCNQTFEDLNVDFDQWMTVRIVFNHKLGVFQFSVNNTLFEKTEEYFKRFQKVNIVFGKNDVLSYETSDIPSMSIKDVVIKKINEKPVYFWSLSQHTTDGVYDEINNHFALCAAPNWILDEHAYWQCIASFNTGIYPQIAFDHISNQIGIADTNSFYIYDIADQSLKTYSNLSGAIKGFKADHMFFNPINKKFFIYDFKGEVAFYDILSRSWSKAQITSTDHPSHWHHNRYFSQSDTTMYTFGGYGFHQYKNDIYTYNFNSKSWNLSNLTDTIAPRYLAGSGSLDGKNLLIFGGYGSENGDQTLSPHNFYDLYSLNLKTKTIHKKWSLKPEKHSFVVANSLITDTLSNSFYALCFMHQRFKTALQVYRFSTNTPSYEILADSIPYFFSDIYSYADLFLTNDRSHLIAITSYTDEKNSKAIIKVYSLAFPALNESFLFQGERETSNYNFYIYLIPVLLGIGVLVMLLLFAKNKKKKNTQTSSAPYSPPRETVEGIKYFQDRLNKKSILLFGGYQVIDNQANDITGEFTPLLKQLFLLMLLHTLKDGRGISSVKLRETLWFDKTIESAKNNRGVSLSKLRTIFEKVGNITISNVNSCWKIEFEEDIYCDYCEVLILMKNLTECPDAKSINRFVAIVSKGSLLPNIETDWIDVFKSDFSNNLIDLLLNIISQASDLNLTPSMQINIADAIFIHDSLNEDALTIKCSLLVKMGKNGLAQKVYGAFVKEYRASFGVTFKYTFEQIIF